MNPHSYSVVDKLNEAYEAIGTAGSESEENLLAEEFGELVIQHWPELLALLRSATNGSLKNG